MGNRKGNKRSPKIGEDGNLVRSESGSLKGVGGKPPGSKNKTTLFKAAMLEGFEERLKIDGERVFDAVVQKAIGPPSVDKNGDFLIDEHGKQMYIDGDTTAMKIIMDRIIPVTRAGDSVDEAGKFNISITVSGVQAQVEEMDSIDADFEEVSNG